MERKSNVKGFQMKMWVGLYLATLIVTSGAWAQFDDAGDGGELAADPDRNSKAGLMFDFGLYGGPFGTDSGIASQDGANQQPAGALLNGNFVGADLHIRGIYQEQFAVGFYSTMAGLAKEKIEDKPHYLLAYSGAEFLYFFTTSVFRLGGGFGLGGGVVLQVEDVNNAVTVSQDPGVFIFEPMVESAIRLSIIELGVRFSYLVPSGDLYAGDVGGMKAGLFFRVAFGI